MSRVPVVTAVALVLVLGACQKKTPVERTKSWFAVHARELETVRVMLEADHGLVTRVGLTPTGGLASAGGAKGSCNSLARSGDFPWTCSGGVVVRNVEDAEAFLGLSPGRLREYERALPTKTVQPGPPCGPPGSLLFYRADNDSPTCTSDNNILWSPTPPPDPTSARSDSDPKCARTIPSTYLPLGGGWYQDACR